jgi:hypothetical protein
MSNISAQETTMRFAMGILAFGASCGGHTSSSDEVHEKLVVRFNQLVRKYFSDQNPSTIIQDKKQHGIAILETALALAKGDIQP